MTTVAADSLIEKDRFNMVEQQVRPWYLKDERVRELLFSIPREQFVPAAYQKMAFMDVNVPLLDGEAMLSTKVVARIVQDVAIQKHESVLEIGTGSGYMTAFLSHFASNVISLEINSKIAQFASDNLKRLGVQNVTVRLGDGSQEIPAETPFDVIVLTGSVAKIPKSLLSHLKIGGRLFAVTGQAPTMQATLVTRENEQNYAIKKPWDIVTQRLHGFPEPSQFEF